MTKKISPELAAALKAEEADRIAPDLAALLTPDEREILRAARQHARLTGISLFDVSSQIIAMTGGDLAARQVADRIGVPWPDLPDFLFSVWPPPFGATFLPKLFIEQRWGELLVAAVEAGDGTACADLLASPVIRVLLGMARDGLHDGRPEFEDVARRLAAALSPRRPQGRRTRRPIGEEERLDHAELLYRAFTALVDWTRLNRPPRLVGPALVAHLMRETDGQRVYWRHPRDGGPVFPFGSLGLHLIYEDALLPFVVEAVETKGKTSSVRAATFHRFAVANGFAPADSTAAGFLRVMRQAVADIRYRKERNSRFQAGATTMPLPDAASAGRKRETHDAQTRPQPPETGREAVQLPARRPPRPQRLQRQPVAKPHRPSRGPRHQARKDGPRPEE